MPLTADTVAEVLVRERARLTAAAVAITRDVHAADDVFQQVVLSALEHCDHFREPDHVVAWGLKVARQRAVQAGRKKKFAWVLPDDVLDALEGKWADPAGVGPGDQADALATCLEKAAPAARQLLHWRYHDGLSAAAIAGRLGRSADAVFQALSRTQRALRACAEKELARRDSRPAGRPDPRPTDR